MALDPIGGGGMKPNEIQPNAKQQQSTTATASLPTASNEEVRGKLLEQSISAFFAKQRALRTVYQPDSALAPPWAAGASATTPSALNGTSGVAGGTTTAAAVAAVPLIPIAIWIGKAAAATTIDAFIDYGISALTGMPPPGALGHVGNFLSNLIPGLGEAKKLKKIAKFVGVLDNIATVAKALDKIPGGTRLVNDVGRHIADLKKAVQAGDLQGAKGIFNNVLGKLREAQVATRLQSNGATVEHLGRKLKDGVTGQVLTDIDVVTREGGHLVFNQIKGGKNALNFTRGSNSWDRFARQAEATFKGAQQNGAKVTYYVDDISAEARQHLKDLSRRYGVSIEIKNNGDFLR